MSNAPQPPRPGSAAAPFTAAESVDFAADLMQRRASAFVDSGHLDEAVNVYDEMALTYRAMIARAPVPDGETARRQRLHLGRVLSDMGSLQARLRRPDEALALTREALDTVRGLGPVDSVMAGYVLARVLWGFAWVRAALGVEGRAALEAGTEAEAILRRMAPDAPASLAGPIQGDLPVVQAFVAQLRAQTSS